MVSAPEPAVAILGLGYVGLPLAEAAAASGRKVIGFDINPGVVEALNAGTSHVDDIPDSAVEHMRSQGFQATAEAQDLAPANVYVICVPTPLSETGGPDLGAVTGAARTVAATLRAGDLVILESTTYPGTTDTILRPLLEESGLTAGEDFHLAFSPERIDPGNAVFTLRNTPKIVGGLTPHCRDAAVRFYEPLVDNVVLAAGLREAEMAKLLENTYRHVNIALVNEMLRFCNDLNIDLWNVIDTAATKPFGFQAFYPGPGVGGHCIPIDPNYLSHFVRAQTGYAFRLVELAQEINAQMPAYVVSQLQDLLNADGLSLNGASVLLVGVAYKADISDTRESPSYAIARALIAKGCDVSYNDPHVAEWVVDGHSVPHMEDLATAAQASDCAILLQRHSTYDINQLTKQAKRLLDTRGATEPGAAHRL